MHNCECVIFKTSFIWFLLQNLLMNPKDGSKAVLQKRISEKILHFQRTKRKRSIIIKYESKHSNPIYLVVYHLEAEKRTVGERGR